jgi:hypothetical protein
VIAGRATEGIIAAASTPIIYFIVRIFQQREDHYRQLREQKHRHLEYGNGWLMAIQTIAGIDDDAKRAAQQKQLIGDMLKGLGDLETSKELTRASEKEAVIHCRSALTMRWPPQRRGLGPAPI